MRMLSNRDRTPVNYCIDSEITSEDVNSWNRFRKNWGKSPEDVRLYRLLGDAYASYVFDRENLPEAIVMYQQGIELAPKDTELLASLAKAYTQQRNYEEAIELYKQAINIKPGEPFARSLLMFTIAQENIKRR